MRDYIYMDIFTICLGLSFQTYWVLWDIISRWISDDEHGENFSTCIMKILDEWIHPVFIKYFWFLLGFSTNFMGIIFNLVWDLVIILAPFLPLADRRNICNTSSIFNTDTP